MRGITRRVLRPAALVAAMTLGALVLLTGTGNAAGGVPARDHVVVVVMENHSYSQIIGSSSAPYLNSLAGQGASFNHSSGVTHPSEPNYLALFSGSTQGITDDSCPHTFSTANLGQELIGAARTFTGYSESMPSDGYTGCTSGNYARKHNPWVNFSNVPSADNLRFSRFPTNYATLPTVSFVVPNQCNDMHNCSIATGDTWLKNNIDAYAQWAKTHNSILVLTFDEDDSGHSNNIPTIIVGSGVKTGTFTETINHYNVLRTIEDMYALPYAGNSATATPITDIWQ
ncbi:Phosphatidylinositol-3-phosphatase [Frankia sp. AgKG'84/4]